MDNENALVPVNAGWIAPDEARVNVTYKGKNGDLPDAVRFDAPDGDVKGWIAEAIRTGSIPGIDVDPDIDLRDFVLDRFEATEIRPYSLLQLRPKTPFGMAPGPREENIGLHRQGAPSTNTGEYYCRDCRQVIGLNGWHALCPARPRMIRL